MNTNTYTSANSADEYRRISDSLITTVMSAVTKSFLDNNHFRYICSSDANDRFADTYRVLLPITLSAITEVRITTRITREVTIKVPEYNLEFSSPENMRPSDLTKLLEETFEIIRFRCTGNQNSVS